MLFAHQVAPPPASEGKNWDDYILVSQEGDLPAPGGGNGRGGGSVGGGAGAGGGLATPPVRRARGAVRLEPEGVAGGFQDPLIACGTSGSSSPDEGSTNSKDSDFTIVNPSDL